MTNDTLEELQRTPIQRLPQAEHGLLQPAGAIYYASKTQWMELIGELGNDQPLGHWLAQQIGSLRGAEQQAIFLTPEKDEVVACHWPDAETIATHAGVGAHPASPEETVMTWNTTRVWVAPSVAGEGVRNLYLGPTLAGVLRDDGAQWRVEWQRGEGERTWVRPLEGAHDTLHDAARAVLGVR